MPECINDWTNCFWNRIKAINSGAIVITVAAVMMDQSTPDSGAPKIARPTVRGRLLTELVITRGQRKLFQ